MSTALQLGPLSESVDGKPIVIARTSTLGNTIHVAVNGTGLTIDRVTVEIVNNDSIAHLVTCEIGGGAQANRFLQSIPANAGRVTVLDRAPLRNSVVVTMFADTASVLAALGSYVRGTP
jgi:hypothetical protein